MDRHNGLLIKYGNHIMRKFYAFEYAEGPRTKIGKPHKKTRNRNTAGRLRVFNCPKIRDQWVSEGEVTELMHGNCREPVSAKHWHHKALLGAMSTEEFNVYIEFELELSTEN